MAQGDDLWSLDAPVTQAPRRPGVKPAQTAPAAAPGADLYEMDQPAAPTVGTAEDVGRSVLAKGVRGVASIPGMFGDIPALFGAEKYRPPTTEEYVQKLGGISPGVKAALDYQPQTTAGRYAGSVAEFAPGALIPGGQARLATRAISGVGAGVGSQAAEDIVRKSESPLEGTPYEAGLKIAGALAGGLAAPKGVAGVQNVFKSPETIAAERLAAAKASDIATGSARMAPAEAAAEGVAPIAAGGAQTQQLVKAASTRASEPAIGAYREAVGELAQAAPGKVDETLSSIFGRVPQPFEAMDELSRRVKEVNSANYGRVMAMPEAQRISNPGLNQIAARIAGKDKDVYDDIMTSLTRQGIDPQTVGLMPTQYGYKIPPAGASLRFWDEVKQGLDAKINSLYDPTTRTIKPGNEKQVSDLLGLKKDLVGVLDNVIPDYKQIRFEGAELYGARDAIDAGRKFFADADPKKLHLRRQSIAKLSDEQKADLAFGYAGALRDSMLKNPTQAFGQFSGKTGAFNINKMREALGDENANKVLGSISGSLLNSTVRDFVAGPGSGRLSMIPGAAAGAGGGYLAAAVAEAAQTGANIFQTLASFNVSLPTFIAMAGGASAKAIYNLRERKIADQIMRLAADPSQEARLGELIAKNPDARSFMQKTLELMARSTPPVAASTVVPEEERTQRASGGRTGSGIAESLMRAAEKAKRELAQETEALLNKPDEHIAKALEIAKKNI